MNKLLQTFVFMGVFIIIKSIIVHGMSSPIEMLLQTARQLMLIEVLLMFIVGLNIQNFLENKRWFNQSHSQATQTRVVKDENGVLRQINSSIASSTSDHPDAKQAYLTSKYALSAGIVGLAILYFVQMIGKS